MLLFIERILYANVKIWQRDCGEIVNHQMLYALEYQSISKQDFKYLYWKEEK